MEADTTAGRVRGRRGPDGFEFRGIPYAIAGRWQPPSPPAVWAGVRDALQYGPAAPQPARAVADFTHGPTPSQSEAGCLNANVYTPSLEGERPVFVWLHGGGFAIGHGAASLYHGAKLARQADAVVVTLNYRLGSLGWLAHRELARSDDAPSANWGLLDQLAALEWVRDNIDAFGGDPTRVTLAGQSAGALCAIDLMVTRAAAGLFQRAVLQSPPLGDVAQPPARAAAWAEAISRLAGGGETFDAQRLRGLPAQEIVDLHESLLEQPEFRGTRGGALPTLDPQTLPQSPADVPGASPWVDVLIGSTAREGSFFFGSPWRPAPPPERIPAIVAHLTGEEPGVVLERYREGERHADQTPTDQELLISIATDAIVAGPVERWARARAAAVTDAGSRVYRYRFDHPGAGPQLKATHTAEVPLLFGTWCDGGPGERLGGQAGNTQEVADALLQAWTRFIHGDSPGWEAIAANDGGGEVAVFGGSRPLRVEQA